MSSIPITSSSLSAQIIAVVPAVLPQNDLHLHRFTVDEYEQMINAGILDKQSNVELLEGVIVEMSPQGIGHDYAVDFLALAIQPLLPVGWYLRNQGTLKLTKSLPIPDLLIMRGSPETYRKRRPLPEDIGLLIEVADSSLKKDRNDKGFIYASSAVPVYWIVNLVGKCLEIYHLDATASIYLPVKVLNLQDTIELELDGKVIGRLSVSDMIP